MLGSKIGLVTVMYTAQKGFTGGLAAFHIGLGTTALSVLLMVVGSLLFPDKPAPSEA